MIDNPCDLPYLDEIFQRLCRGRHICAEDGNYYHALYDNFDLYQQLFDRLGFRLEVHPRDFYYFRGEKSLSDTSSRMALFIFILMEFLEGQGEPVAESILTREFTVADMPHFATERYRLYMKESGIADHDGLEGVVNNLEKFGFAVRKGGLFRFRSPVYRFFDICHAILQSDQTRAESEVSP
jgi:hypothetical protein